MAFINESNSKGLSYTLGETPFTDLEYEEFLNKYTGVKNLDNDFLNLHSQANVEEF